MDTTAISPRRFLSIACTIVGCGLGGSTSMLAHVILVDYHGNTVFDNHVAPTMFISDYRTSVTGLLPMHLDGAPEFTKVQRDVADKIHGKVLVGHAIWNDLSVLGLQHLAVATRDVALYMPFRITLSTDRVIGLQTLMWHFMARQIQRQAIISPLENARAAMDLYRSAASDWNYQISRGNWPCALPSSTFSRCYL
ncbi:hypothetical protein FIBSPDRAFT_722515 [Athelia psychrophila]|uniref:Exonuclease domain-containing protein n=1 Tax=Athelia psychrophila TaxID=1759441 RepID=A0A166V8T6_9AGAM|nr:hypothetical protein FIBSPDRAFT_722515 [Fibularhizoctonia sp. CBS 109695]